MLYFLCLKSAFKIRNALNKGDRDDCNKFVGLIAILLNIVDVSGFPVFVIMINKILFLV